MDITVVILVMVWCFICGLILGFLLFHKPAAQTVPVSEIEALRKSLYEWNTWYSRHMPECRSLAKSNAAGYALLEELNAAVHVGHERL